MTIELNTIEIMDTLAIIAQRKERLRAMEKAGLLSQKAANEQLNLVSALMAKFEAALDRTKK